MQQNGWNRIKILSRGIKEGKNHHSEKKHGNVTEQDGEWMAHEQIENTPTGGSLPVLFAGHDGKRADVGTAQLAVVAVMVIM